MWRWVTAMALAFGLAGGVAQADETAIQGVIDSQIAAFRADDFETAFTYAAPGIQGMFRNPTNFGRMVREGYPMVWRPSQVEYLGTRTQGAIWRQDVLVTDAQGQVFTLAYSMVETAEGWKIAGVELLRQPDVGA
ncbi:MAG: DUF4864 domain-containing protein [Pseudomonadota bacterium]